MSGFSASELPVPASFCRRVEALQAALLPVDLVVATLSDLWVVLQVNGQ